MISWASSVGTAACATCSASQKCLIFVVALCDGGTSLYINKLCELCESQLKSTGTGKGKRTERKRDVSGRNKLLSRACITGVSDFH